MKEFQIDNDVESKGDEKEFSNQLITKPRELYFALDGAQPKKEHVENNANEHKESKERVVLSAQVNYIIPDFDGEIGNKKIHNHFCRQQRSFRFYLKGVASRPGFEFSPTRGERCGQHRMQNLSFSKLGDLCNCWKFRKNCLGINFYLAFYFS